jgi:hypothetical protein
MVALINAQALRLPLDAMQRWQRTLPEPYRTECCDILANGKIGPWRHREEQHEG